MENKPELFELLAEHELRNSERYQRFFTVLVCSVGKPRDKFRQLFSGFLRVSDAVIESKPLVTVLMGETDSEGALAAMHRLQHAYGGAVSVRFGAASYPSDGRDIPTLLDVARKRLDEGNNQNHDRPSVVNH